MQEIKFVLLQRITPIALVKKVLNPEEYTLAFLFLSFAAVAYLFPILTEYLFS